MFGSRRKAVKDPDGTKLRVDLLLRSAQEKDAADDVAGALRDFVAAVDLVEALRVAEPHNVDHLRVLRNVYARIGLLRRAVGDLKGAARAYQRAVDAAESTARVSPSSQHQVELADVRYELGRTNILRFDPGARPCLLAAIADYSAAEPRQYRDDCIADAHQYLARQFAAEGAYTTAVARIQQAILTQLPQAETGGLTWDRDTSAPGEWEPLAMLLATAADVYYESGHPDLAISCAEASQEMFRRLEFVGGGTLNYFRLAARVARDAHDAGGRTSFADAARLNLIEAPFQARELMLAEESDGPHVMVGGSAADRRSMGQLAEPPIEWAMRLPDSGDFAHQLRTLRPPDARTVLGPFHRLSPEPAAALAQTAAVTRAARAALPVDLSMGLALCSESYAMMIGLEQGGHTSAELRRTVPALLHHGARAAVEDSELLWALNLGLLAASSAIAALFEEPADPELRRLGAQIKDWLVEMSKQERDAFAPAGLAAMVATLEELTAGA